jgi:hypothetical protein
VDFVQTVGWRRLAHSGIKGLAKQTHPNDQGPADAYLKRQSSGSHDSSGIHAEG